MNDFQTRRTTSVANTGEAFAKHRFRMALSFWRRVKIELMEGTQEFVRVRDERVFDRQPISDEMYQEQGTQHEEDTCR